MNFGDSMASFKMNNDAIQNICRQFATHSGGNRTRFIQMLRIVGRARCVRLLAKRVLDISKTTVNVMPQLTVLAEL
jgi:hypothetical protein